MKTTKPAAKFQTNQNPVAVAMAKRHAHTTCTMKHRNAPRGGARNKQAAYRSDNY